jgi:hypothetical protein
MLYKALKNLFMDIYCPISEDFEYTDDINNYENLMIKLFENNPSLTDIRFGDGDPYDTVDTASLNIIDLLSGTVLYEVAVKGHLRELEKINVQSLDNEILWAFPTLIQECPKLKYFTAREFSYEVVEGVKGSSQFDCAFSLCLLRYDYEYMKNALDSLKYDLVYLTIKGAIIISNSFLIDIYIISSKYSFYILEFLTLSNFCLDYCQIKYKELT